MSNEEFDVAYGDPLNRRAINSICKRFLNSIEYDELQQNGRIGLLKCLRSFDPRFNQKFTASLRRLVLWECLSTIRSQESVKNWRPLVDEPAVYEREDVRHVYECMEMLTDFDRDIIRKYYLDNMTLKEIGGFYSFSGEAARQRLNKATGRLRNLCGRNYVSRP